MQHHIVEVFDGRVREWMCGFPSEGSAREYIEDARHQPDELWAHMTKQPNGQYVNYSGRLNLRVERCDCPDD